MGSFVIVLILLIFSIFDLLVLGDLMLNLGKVGVIFRFRLKNDRINQQITFNGWITIIIQIYNCGRNQLGWFWHDIMCLIFVSHGFFMQTCRLGILMDNTIDFIFYGNGALG